MDGTNNDQASGKEGETYLSYASAHLLEEGHCSGLRQTGEREMAHRIVPVECLGGLASPEQMMS
ncbi:hypothetical protein KVR01_003005 [Diaporthe batatas]|uniref:uncharacterized protein n=1 Tax=Diaporthe batatas TaxID=748121 RepID=UPI001D043F12|nr:uncharacterized protein KVR01_003005 [Diaporthe batatas]KAG8167316.1 hypothetical protein KVR01_003005 [Diaporthe batatas]